MNAITATDWRAVQREDGSICLECGGRSEEYHMAFDVAIDDISLAYRFCEAMNAWNGRWGR